jgi:hypothetical protein
MLVDMINRDVDSFGALNPADFDGLPDVEASQFDTYDIETLQLIPLMVQTGFLTFRDHEADVDTYTLGYPNYEVRRAFARMVLEVRLKTPVEASAPVIARQIRKYLCEQNIDKVISLLKGVIASIPSNLHTAKESYYHSLIHMVFQMSGLHIRSEAWVSGGRMDTVIEEPDTIYIIEFKFDTPVQVALDQIRTKGYGKMYEHTGKAIKALGISVDCATKTIGGWEMVNLR